MAHGVPAFWPSGAVQTPLQGIKEMGIVRKEKLFQRFLHTALLHSTNTGIMGAIPNRKNR